MVKLQFRKAKRTYKRKTYEYERVSLDFPAALSGILESLREKEVRVELSKQGKTFNVILTEED